MFKSFKNLFTKSSPESGQNFLALNSTGGGQSVSLDDLADAVLDRLTSKTYQLDQGTKNIIRALNELNSNSYKRLNYARNSDIKTYINSQIKNKNFAGYVLFTESTGDPEGIGVGIISYVSPIGTGNVYMEYMYESRRYYGWYKQSDDTDITWKSYKF